MKETREKYDCHKCGKELSFLDGTRIEDKRCIYCGSVNIKSRRLTPSKGEIKAFLTFRVPKCRNCGRKLTNEKSITNGFGPTYGAYFGRKYLKQNPDELGERAKKFWTKEEVEALVNFARGGV